MDAMYRKAPQRAPSRNAPIAPARGMGALIAARQVARVSNATRHTCWRGILRSRAKDAIGLSSGASSA